MNPLIKLRQRKFNKDEWQNNLRSRKYFYRSIIKNQMLIGKNIRESAQLLGTRQREVIYSDSWKVIDLKEWKYFLHKNTFTRRSYSLALYFKNGNVNEVKLVSE